MLSKRRLAFLGLIISSVWTWGVLSAAAAPCKPRIALVEMNVSTNDESIKAPKPDSYILKQLGTTFNVVERASLSSVVSELKLQSGRLFDASTTKKLGQLVGVDYVVVGQADVKVSLLGASWRINVRVLNTATGSAVGLIEAKGSSLSTNVDKAMLSSLDDAMEDFREKLVKVFPRYVTIVQVVDSSTVIVRAEPGFTTGEKLAVRLPLPEDEKTLVPSGRAVVKEIVGDTIVLKFKSRNAFVGTTMELFSLD